MMGFFSGLAKVTLGAVAGVGAIAALPILGPIGAVTATGAAVGSALGGLGGLIAAVGSDDDDAADKVTKAQQKEAAATRRMEQMAENLQKLQKNMQDTQEYAKFTIALFAVGISAANCDGEISQLERTELQQIISGLSAEKTADNIRNYIDELYKNPPTVQQALSYAEPYGDEKFSLFEDIVDLAIHTDDIVHPREAAFLQAWAESAAKLKLKSQFGSDASVAVA